ncbi:MAG TPA: hypothetical protein VN673_10190, partial [Clostridia bacterium]|nr:hypothetical protein [Clostridia bacterium]
FHADRALLLAGGEIKQQGNPAAARELFLWATTNGANSVLLSELELAIARTYEQESKWPEVVRQYQAWLERFPDDPARARAQYACAWASYQARNETNALVGFTRFVAQFPTNELTPLAEWWVADYYFRNGEPLEAEKRYQRLFRGTNWGPSRLTYQAQLMAGRAAMARLGWQDVSPYFINLYKDTNCPTDLRIQALFCFGDYCISRDSTNKLADYDDAISAFNGVRNWDPTNSLAVLALGKIASCYLQKAQLSQDYALALTNFQQVLSHPQADATARSIAKVGMGIVVKKQAELAKPPEQDQLRRQALDHFLDVLYRKNLQPGEQPDLFWVKKAGLEAADVAEVLHEWDGALGVYQQLMELLPQLRPRLEKNILKIQRERLTLGQR